MRDAGWSFWDYDVARAVDRSCVAGSMALEASGEKLNA